MEVTGPPGDAEKLRLGVLAICTLSTHSLRCLCPSAPRSTNRNVLCPPPLRVDVASKTFEAQPPATAADKPAQTPHCLPGVARRSLRAGEQLDSARSCS